MKKALYFSFFLLLPLCFLLASTQATAKSQQSVSFYQPLLKDGEKSDAAWQKLGQDLKSMKVAELFVQWSDHEGYPLYTAAPEEGSPITTPLEKLLTVADNEKIDLWMGLTADKDFWAADKKPIELLKVYFAKREIATQALLDSWGERIKDNPRLKGWYIPDEIDDSRWNEPEKRALLVKYLKNVRQMVAKLTPDLPVAVSGFSNGKLPPDSFIHFFENLTDESAIDRFLFQNGVGAGKMSLDEFSIYRKALLKSDLGKKTHIVVEAFGMSSMGVLAPATASAYKSQMKAAMVAPFKAPVIFSMPTYFFSFHGVKNKQRSENLKKAHRALYK